MAASRCTSAAFSAEKVFTFRAHVELAVGPRVVGPALGLAVLGARALSLLLARKPPDLTSARARLGGGVGWRGWAVGLGGGDGGFLGLCARWTRADYYSTSPPWTEGVAGAR